MKAVILAAGRGKRLSPITDNIPKPLISLSGKPLIEYVISAIDKSGITDFVVIAGYLGEVLRKGLECLNDLDVRIQFIYNPYYRLGNGTSLLCAEKALKVEESFLLAMADHLVEKSLIKKALDKYEGESLLCVDKKPKYFTDIGEATKVLIDEEGFVRDIGKKLSEWNGLDTGLFHLNTEIFNLLKRGNRPFKVSVCMKTLVRESSLRACDVSGHLWFDVDTLEDLKQAYRLIKEWA